MQKRFDGETRYHLTGWILFVICALFFLVSGLENGDLVTCSS